VCGIAGWFGIDGAGLAPGRIRAALDSLRPRGPDGEGVWRGRDGVLLHRRLSVVDLSEAAAEPLPNEDGTVRLVVNGEVYGFRDLRRELLARGHALRSTGDAETIVHLYEDLGDGAIERLDGMFALALFDEPRGRLLLARDRAGKKPLFHVQTAAGGIAFASSPAALAALGAVALECDPRAVPDLVARGYVPAPRTPYRGVRELPPGSTLVWTREGGALTPRRYWSAPFGRPPGADRPPAGLRGAAREVRRVVFRAVERRLVADVPVGVLLSGGLDSTIVAAVAARLLPRPGAALRTLCAGFEDPALDERPYARVVARALGARHEETVVPPPTPALVEALVVAHGGPFGDSSAIATWHLARFAREHVTVALAGDGGDELFAGYLRVAAGATIERVAWPVRRAVAGLARLALDSVGAARRPESRLGRLRRLLTGLDAGGDEGRGPGSILDRRLAHEFETYLPGDLLPKMDRMSMAHGLEVRSPLLDTALVELAASLPDRFKLGPGLRTKRVLREAFKDLVPPAILRRGKRGFGVPLGAWLRGPLRDTVTARLLDPGAHLRRFFDGEGVRRRVEAHLGGRADHGHALWTLLTLETWLDLLRRGALAGAGREADARRA